MPQEQKNITLGTAGHIDHGKTVLIKCLTGCDTDRLKAEKERGMSIDLGFAPCTLANMEVGIVDVPGHENFIKTMVAGASGIDGVIFVIAADDGVMPQTREHLDILTLLGVGHGVVALTKVDCVRPERAKAVAAEVRTFLKGTFLQEAPILPVSGVTGQGFGEFYEALKDLVGRITPKNADGVFRLPVERTFSVKGYGTVVTGIPVSGTTKVGDELVLLPHDSKGRVKAIQVYKRDSQIAVVGQCAALNVTQWDYKTITRGNVVTVEKYFSPHQWYLCELSILPQHAKGIKNGTEVKFHTGTSEVVATVYLLQGNVASAGQKWLAQFRLSEPVVAGPRDRFILRTLSPPQTVGGGMIVEAIPRRLKRNHPDVLQDAQARAKAVQNRKEFVEYCIRTARSFAVTEAGLSIRTKMPLGPLKEILAELRDEGRMLNLDARLYIHRDTTENTGRELLNIVRDFHRDNPESPGIEPKQLHEKSQLQKELFDGLVKRLISQGKLVERKRRLALPQHREAFSEPERRLLSGIESLFKGRPFNPPSFEEVLEHTKAGADEVRKAMRILREQEQLVRVEGDMFFHVEAVRRSRDILTSFIQKEGKMESVKFKYLLDTSRKFAIPLLDYFDRVGVTRREGYTRYLAKSTEMR
jgi:selenocysteine-specific elongation factor